jgi:hypothetical protein
MNVMMILNARKIGCVMIIVRSVFLGVEITITALMTRRIVVRQQANVKNVGHRHTASGGKIAMTMSVLQNQVMKNV